MIKRDLMFCHLGNGFSVCDRLHEEYGDYQRVAHIARDRSIKWYVEIDEIYQQQIEAFASTNDSNISATQDQKVFSSRPQEGNH